VKRPDLALAEVANEQLGLASLAQVVAAGVGRRAAQERAESGRLHRVHRGIYAVGHEALGREGRLLAAVRACGEGTGR
jgi:predicted transcriptional regulator of viral defense system